MRQKTLIIRQASTTVAALVALLLMAFPAGGAEPVVDTEPLVDSELLADADSMARRALQHLGDPNDEGAKVFTGSGFDTCNAPSEATMKGWLDSPYRAVGVYFGGRGRACAKQPNLTPEWARNVDRMGWRLLPLYVGSQSPCVVADNKRNVPIDSTDPRGQGVNEGADAVRRAKDLGLAEKSPLYLDMEHYRYQETQCGAITLDFIQGWSHEVSRLGYLPGYYSSASSGVSHLEEARLAGQDDLPQVMWFARWGVKPSVSDEPSLGRDAWQPHRRIHQYEGDVSESHGGYSLSIDRNQVDAPVAIIR